VTGLLDNTDAAPPKMVEITKADKTTALEPNPLYGPWIAKDQQVLSYLLNSMSPEILAQVVGKDSTFELWTTVTNLFASQSQSRITNLRIAITNTKKGSMSSSAYMAKMKSLGDELAAAGRPVSDPEMVDYILAGLDRDYDPVVAAIGAVKNIITADDLFAQIAAFDQRMEMLGDSSSGGFYSSANAVYRGRGQSRGRSRGRGGRGRGRGDRGDRGDRQSSSSNGGGGFRGRPRQQQQQQAREQQHDYPECQICYRHHPGGARVCWWRYEENDQEEKQVHAVSYGVDTNWYADSAATNHITGELDKLTMREKYNGGDQIRTASGSGMDITHIGSSIVKTPVKNLHLTNVLHVPQTSKNLVSVHRFTLDNNVLIEFYPYFFLVKDLKTRRVILRGRCVGGLYPLISSSSSSWSNKQANIVTKLSTSRWHSRLGHPSSVIVRYVLSKNKLSYEPSSESVCDPCQQAKSHQLPYPISTSVSTAPLQLIFSDVWGPAPISVGRFSYYVSFIDDYSKFTWIYLLKKRSDVFQVFLNFQNLVERKLNSKIIAMQSDWGGEYEKLNSFFQKLGISHHVSCPHAHQQNGSAERKHRHIVDMGLALLANASMPLKFWDEAFLTATYLINLLPSKVIKFETPITRLLGVTPNYTSLRIFGCACWPNLRPYNTRKLAFRSKRCVFLGYSPMHKGVKCLDVPTGRVYISRDVVFDESVFPFASLHPNAGALLRKEILLLPSHLRSFDHGGDNNCTNQCDDIPAGTGLSLMPVQVPGENGAQNDQDLENMAGFDPIFHAEEGDEAGTDDEEDLAAPATPARAQILDHATASASDQAPDGSNPGSRAGHSRAAASASGGTSSGAESPSPRAPASDQLRDQILSAPRAPPVAVGWRILCASACRRGSHTRSHRIPCAYDDKSVHCISRFSWIFCGKYTSGAARVFFTCYDPATERYTES